MLLTNNEKLAVFLHIVIVDNMIVEMLVKKAYANLVELPMRKIPKGLNVLDKVPEDMLKSTFNPGTNG